MTVYQYCEQCRAAWGPDNGSDHPDHCGKKIEFPGIVIFKHFVTEEEERTIMTEIDKTDFVESQSGRRKQVN